MSVVSVSAAPSHADADATLETRAQAALAALRREVLEMLERGDGEAAAARVRELRDVCGVWKGTGEERARGRWVDGLEAVVEDGGEGRGKAGGSRPRLEDREGSAVRGGESGASGAGPGFLRRLRDEIYME